MTQTRFHPRPLTGSPTGSTRPRIAFYSHDAQGLGHLRRNLALAHALATLDPRPTSVVLSGADEASAFTPPPGCDVVRMPGITKNSQGDYRSRHLDLDLAAVVRLRTTLLCSTIREFAPDLLIVDKYPRGFAHELEPTLEALSPHTTVVLGLRDVLDAPETAAAEWADAAATPALRRWYDAVWVFGDARVTDPIAGLHLPHGDRPVVNYVGYLSHGRSDQHVADHPLSGRRYVLGLAGGGGDGEVLAASFAASTFPDGVHGVFVAGPHLDDDARRKLHAQAGLRPDLTVLDFVPDLTCWLDHANAVITMGGYNSVCEVLCRAAPALVVPRVHPRQEQLRRAEALAATGAVDVLHPRHLTPRELGSWVTHAVGQEPRPRTGIDLDGIARVRGLATRLLTREEYPHAAV